MEKNSNGGNRCQCGAAAGQTYVQFEFTIEYRMRCVYGMAQFIHCHKQCRSARAFGRVNSLANTSVWLNWAKLCKMNGLKSSMFVRIVLIHEWWEKSFHFVYKFVFMARDQMKMSDDRLVQLNIKCHFNECLFSLSFLPPFYESVAVYSRRWRSPIGVLRNSKWKITTHHTIQIIMLNIILVIILINLWRIE